MTPFYMAFLYYLGVTSKLYSRAFFLVLISILSEAVLVVPYYLAFSDEIPFYIELVSFGVAAIVVTIYIRRYMNNSFGEVFWGANITALTSGLVLGLFLPV